MKDEMKQMDYEWELLQLLIRLVPEWGEADTVQGEMVRIVERFVIPYCVQEGSTLTSTRLFRRLPAYLYRQLCKGIVFDADTLLQIRRDIEEIRALAQAPGEGFRRSGEPGAWDALYRLRARVVDWCRHHPDLIPRQVTLTPLPVM